MAEKAKASGTAFQSRDEAVKQFQQKYSTTYTSRYDREPSSRPTYIPRTTYIDNRNYNVYYDSHYNGYGYMDYYGHWRYYDAFADAVVLSALMSNHSYYYQQPVIVQQPTYVQQDGQQTTYAPQPVIVQQSSGWGASIFFGIVIGVVVLVVIGFLVSRD